MEKRFIFGSCSEICSVSQQSRHSGVAQLVAVWYVKVTAHVVTDQEKQHGQNQIWNLKGHSSLSTSIRKASLRKVYTAFLNITTNYRTSALYTSL